MEISLPTLYAYVSRGLIRSEAGTGKSRARRYWRADVDALLARKALRQNPAQAAETALHWGTPVLASAVTLIEDGRFFYRGHEAIELAQTAAFESVASLLWRDQLDASDLFPPEIPESVAQRLVALQPTLQSLPLFERFQAALPLLAGHDLAAIFLYGKRPFPKPGHGCFICLPGWRRGNGRKLIWRRRCSRRGRPQILPCTRSSTVRLFCAPTMS